MAINEDDDLGFAVPGQEEEPFEESISRPVYENTGKEKGITLFWLLQHYNKENAAAYKEQKERKKAEKNAAKKPESPNRQKPKAAKEKAPVRPSASSYGRVPKKKEPAYENAEDANFGETVIVNREDRPGCASVRPGAALECMGFGKTVKLQKLPFLIGRSLQGVDLCIADNKSVGRQHAVISYRDGLYYMKDLKSLNHVYLDGKQIQAEKEIPLYDGAKIMLGTEAFLFHILDA